MGRLIIGQHRLPGIGEKTASRLAFNLLNRPRDQVIALAESLLADVARGVYECTRYNLKETPHG